MMMMMVIIILMRRRGRTSAGMLGSSLSLVHGSSRPGMNGRSSVGRASRNTWFW